MTQARDIAAKRRARAIAKAEAIRKALNTAAKAEQRLQSAETAKTKAIAEADKKVGDATKKVDEAYVEVATETGSDQVAADLLGIPTARIRSARVSRNGEVPSPKSNNGES